MLDLLFSLHVHGGGRVVQNQDGRADRQGPGQGNSLFLAARETDSALAHDGIVAFRHLGNEIRGGRVAGKFYHVIYLDGTVAVGDVTLDGVGIEEHILGGEADVAAQIVEP